MTKKRVALRRASASRTRARKPAVSRAKARKEPSRAALPIPSLRAGEDYIGAVIGADGKGHHIILLAGDESGPTWQEMMDWAKARGGDLPDRVEQALLFRDHKDKFQAARYWSNCQHAATSEYAWFQGFGNGYQGYWPKADRGRARAVRRVPI